MKVEKAEKIKNNYPKIEELNKKESKIKVGVITSLLILLKSKFVAAKSPTEIMANIENTPTPGDEPIFIPTIYRYTKLGFVAMLIISIISSIVIKIKWKKYNPKQRKIAKIILSISLTLTIILMITSIILKFQ